MPELAAIDIGSNAIRMTLAGAGPDGSLNYLRHFREAVRLGEEAFGKGLISETAAARALQALKALKAETEKVQPALTKIAATEALRRAGNGRELAEGWSRELGVPVEIITAGQEAVLVGRVVAEKPEFKGKEILHFELGGGSLELSVISNGRMIDTGDFELGAVRLLKAVEPFTGDRQRLTSEVRELSRTAREWLKLQVLNHKPQLLAGTGGGVEVLAELASKADQTQDKDCLTLQGLDKILDVIVQLTPEQRTARLGLKPDRADVILPAALVVRELLESSGFDRLHLPRVSLRDGMLLEMADKMSEQKV
jgi:exopolyphosphatase/guanosine-5'-triphosphate,3'-diphosphate pyrophosphatase